MSGMYYSGKGHDEGMDVPKNFARFVICALRFSTWSKLLRFTHYEFYQSTDLWTWYVSEFLKILPNFQASLKFCFLDSYDKWLWNLYSYCWKERELLIEINVWLFISGQQQILQFEFIHEIILLREKICEKCVGMISLIKSLAKSDRIPFQSLEVMPIFLVSL